MQEEISKARKLILEKDAKFHVAEESHSGLKEVLHLGACGLSPLMYSKDHAFSCPG